MGRDGKRRIRTMITKKQAEQVLPHVRAAVAALHEVWEKCREVEQTLGRDLDGLERAAATEDLRQ